MYNQPFSPPPPPPVSSGGGNNMKYILGGLGALGCLGIIGLAILLGVYFTYIKKNNNANNVNYVANVSPSPGNNPNGNIANTNGNDSNTSNDNTNTNVGGGMRSRIQQQVRSFRLRGAVTPVQTAPTYSYTYMNQASQILTNAINNAGAQEALLARYVDSRAPTADFHRVDHRVVTCASPAEANALMERIATQLQGAGYNTARRAPTQLTDGRVNGSKIFMETGRTDLSDEVVLWTNGNLFCSAATGKRGNATQFEAGTSY